MPAAVTSGERCGGRVVRRAAAADIQEPRGRLLLELKQMRRLVKEFSFQFPRRTTSASTSSEGCPCRPRGGANRHDHMESNYRVKSAKGAIVRSGRALDTDLVETLASGAAVEVEAIRTSPAFFHVFG